jgi:predicted Zn finger-like uncharacterized protein
MAFGYTFVFVSTRGCMGSRRIQCPSCGQAYVLTDDEAARFAGQTIECSQCGHEIALAPSPNARDASIGLIAPSTSPGQGAAPPRIAPAQPAPFNPPELTAGAYPAPAIAPTAYAVPPMPMAMAAAQPQYDLRATYSDDPDGTGWAIASILCALVGLLVPIVPGAIAILLGLIALFRAKSSRTFAGGGLALSGIASGILTILFGSAVLHNYVMPAIANARSAAVRDVSCSQHLDQISRALQAYASKHDGHFPDQVGALVACGDLQAEMLICPRTGDTVAPGTTPAHRAEAIAKGGHCSYVYCGSGLTKDSPAESVLMYEPLDRHKEKGITVIFADGRVAPIGEVEAAKALRRLSAGQNPPWSQ